MEGPGKLNKIFEEYSEDTNDTQLQWSNMGPKITNALKEKKEKGKKRFFWWWLSGMGSILGIVIFFLVFNSSESEVNINSAKVANTITYDNVVLNEVNDSNDELVEVTTQNSHEEQKVEMDKQVEIQGDEFTKSNTYELLTIEKDNAKISTESSNVRISDLMARSDENNRKTLNKSYSSSSEAQNKSAVEINIVQVKNKFIENFKEVQELEYLIALKEREVANPEYLFDQWMGDTNIADFNSAFIYMHGGINFSNIHQKYSNSSALLGSNIEVGYQKNMSSKIYATLGLAYEQIRFQTAFEQSEATQLFRPGTIDTIYNYGFGNETVILTDFIDGIRSRSFGNTNILNTLTIPIQIGYQFHIGKLILAPEMGIAFTVDQRKDFRIANSDFEVSERKSNSTWSMYPLLRGGLAIQVPLTNDIYVSSRYSLSAQSIHDSGGIGRSRTMVQGVQMGVLYRLSK